MNVVFRIKNALTMQQAVQRYSLHKLNKHKMPCIYHNDKTPSMHIYNSSFYCFSCQRSGDVIDFVAGIQGIDNKQAIKFLIKDLHLEEKHLNVKKELDLFTAMKLEKEMVLENPAYFKAKMQGMYINTKLCEQLKDVVPSTTADFTAKQKIQMLVDYWRQVRQGERNFKRRVRNEMQEYIKSAISDERIDEILWVGAECLIKHSPMRRVV